MGSKKRESIESGVLLYLQIIKGLFMKNKEEYLPRDEKGAYLFKFKLFCLPTYVNLVLYAIFILSSL